MRANTAPFYVVAFLAFVVALFFVFDESGLGVVVSSLAVTPGSLSPR